MSVLSKPADRSYPIDDSWIDSHRDDKDAYVDIQEIIDGQSQYVTDLGLNKGEESSKASFIHTGIRTDVTANDAHTNTAINCQYMGDTFHKVRHFVGKMVHPERIKRVYAYGTTAEGIQWEGFTA